MKDSIRWWTIGVGAALVVGSFLPWARAGIFSMSGTEGDGVFTAVMGGAILLIGVANRPTVGAGMAILGLGVASLWISGAAANNVLSNLGEDAIGTGLMLTPAAALFATFNGLQWRSAAKAASSVAAADAEGGGEPEAPVAPATSDDVAGRLDRLTHLLSSGAISQEEHDRRRGQILDDI